MATTRLIPMHVIKGQTVANTVHERIAYAANPDKTNNGNYISAFGCDLAMAAAEMLLCKREYETVVGRADEKRNDILLYQIRQSFRPGEIKPEQAQKIGYELAMRFTKGKYQFVVATHVDHAHIHNHIIYNSTSLDHTQKFRNFLGSSHAIRNISDRLCIENQLSVLDNPQSGHTHYGKWLGNKKPVSWQDKLRVAIDQVVAQKPDDFEVFLMLLQKAGYEVKQGKYLAFRAAGQEKFTRLRSLGEGYSEDELQAVIRGEKYHVPKAGKTPTKVPARLQKKVNLLVDIQVKLMAGKGPGYECWAKVFNLKQMAQTINYLTEHNITDYDILVEKTKAVTEQYYEITKQIKTAESRRAEIASLKKHIINYSKTRNVYADYRKVGYSRKFYDEHVMEILLHKASKEAFDALPDKKIPAMKDLQKEYECCFANKNKFKSIYTCAKSEMREILTVKANIDRLMNEDIFTQPLRNMYDR